jgi:hypothetical protein
MDEIMRIARQFAKARSQGDRTAGLILAGRAKAWYREHKLRGIWDGIANEWFEVTW